MSYDGSATCVEINLCYFFIYTKLAIDNEELLNLLYWTFRNTKSINIKQMA